MVGSAVGIAIVVAAIPPLPAFCAGCDGPGGSGSGSGGGGDAVRCGCGGACGACVAIAMAPAATTATTTIDVACAAAAITTAETTTTNAVSASFTDATSVLLQLLLMVAAAAAAGACAECIDACIQVYILTQARSYGACNYMYMCGCRVSAECQLMVVGGYVCESNSDEVAAAHSPPPSIEGNFTFHIDNVDSNIY